MPEERNTHSYHPLAILVFNRRLVSYRLKNPAKKKDHINKNLPDQILTSGQQLTRQAEK
jgi:hypothetical protein